MPSITLDWFCVLVIISSSRLSVLTVGSSGSMVNLYFFISNCLIAIGTIAASVSRARREAPRCGGEGADLDSGVRHGDVRARSGPVGRFQDPQSHLRPGRWPHPVLGPRPGPDDLVHHEHPGGRAMSAFLTLSSGHRRGHLESGRRSFTEGH